VNEGPEWGPLYQKKIVEYAPSNAYTITAAIACKSLAEDRKKEIYKSGEKKCKRSDNSFQSRLDCSRYNDGPMQ